MSASLVSSFTPDLHSLIPGAAFATAKGGHAYMWEHPKPFNEALLPSSESTENQGNSTFW